VNRSATCGDHFSDKDTAIQKHQTVVARYLGTS